jgi:7-cyano-7-deazaguanine synthase in queuosine biosynthesis
MEQEPRRDRTRTLDRVLEKYDNPDQILNAYRIELLEEAKDALCIATGEIRAEQSRNTVAPARNATTIKLAGAILALASGLVITVSGLGWLKLAQFTDRMYAMREADHEIFSNYQLHAQSVNMTQNQALSDQTEILKKHREMIENIDMEVRAIRRDLQSYKNTVEMEKAIKKEIKLDQVLKENAEKEQEILSDPK